MTLDEIRPRRALKSGLVVRTRGAKPSERRGRPNLMQAPADPSAFIAQTSGKLLTGPQPSPRRPCSFGQWCIGMRFASRRTLTFSHALRAGAAFR